jgi:hypothetical protein
VTSTTLTTVEDCAGVVGELFDSVYARIEEWRAAIEAYTTAHGGTVSRSGIDRLVEKNVMDHLGTHRLPIIGAGFVATPGFVADAHWHLAWWLGDANTFGIGRDRPSIRRLDTVEDPTSERFRDYTTLEWWRIPQRTGRRHITGPYVDYLCTDEYTLTLTVPAFSGGQMIGVAGADLYVKDVERALLPPLRGVGPDATLVNASGRVLASTNAHVATGSVMRSITHDRGAAVACGDTGFSIFVGG